LQLDNVTSLSGLLPYLQQQQQPALAVLHGSLLVK